MKEDIFYRVLLIENDEDELDKFRTIITSNFPAVVYSAQTSKDALLSIDYHTYDVILINANMPGLDGAKLAEYAERSFMNSMSPIIFMGTNPEIAPQPRNLNSPPIEYLKNPISTASLVDKLGLYFRFISTQKALNEQLKLEISARKHLEQELNKSRENFRNIVEKSNAGILIMDSDGIIQFINEAGEQIFLRKKEELINNQFGFLSGYKKKSEIDIIRKNGEIGTGEITTTDSEWMGKPATLILINDITKHKKLQESLETEKLRAQESDRLKTAFLANMSHEIRTPLNGILGFSQLLDTNDLDVEDRHKYLDTIISCGDYLLGIINDIIDIAQLEVGQITPKETNFDIIAMVHEIEALYKVNPKLTAKNLQLRVEAPPTPSLIIHSDPLRVKQVLVNLINNAIKFTDTGTIKVSLVVKDENLLEFMVADTGIGIPKSEFRNIFERFRQVEATRDRLNEGTGLGLSIAKGLVNMLGGKIWLKSKQNVGTTFYFTIKASVISTSGLSDPQNNNSMKDNFRNKKILIVEDEETNYLFLATIFEKFGVIIYWAKNGNEAVEIAQKEDIDLILMDMKLPLKNGYEATKEIRHLKPFLPIIAQTAYAMSTDKDKVLEAGCNDYISKPIKVPELVSKMNNFLN